MILPLSNRKNVTKLPDEFKRGFTIFYVKDISQVYKICFDTDEKALLDGSAFEGLTRDYGIEVEKYEDDTLSSQVLQDQEQVLGVAPSGKRNFIEDLLS